ncbi:MAG: C-type lectin domain-containing protein [Sandaracinaceae bacterium]|nr:C-type lectin domain-containing protein [Sandaracinaceae bacterium]
MRGLFVAIGWLGIVGCTSGPRVLVTVESDLAIPDALDEVRVEIAGRAASAPLTAPGALPATLELRGANDRLGPYELVVVGSRGGAEIGRVTRALTFEADATTRLTVRLDGCGGRICGADERCDAGACVPLEMPDAGPAPDGSAPLDAGPDDAGPHDAGAVARDACLPELCNGLDDDCDGDVDEAGCEPCARSVFERRDYLSCELPRPQAEARAYCRARGYDLVSIASAAENTHVSGTRTGEPFLGLVRASGQDFVWVDGDPGTYRNWQGAGPGAQDCATMRMTGSWVTTDCASARPFVCALPRP